MFENDKKNFCRMVPVEDFQNIFVECCLKRQARQAPNEL